MERIRVQNRGDKSYLLRQCLQWRHINASAIRVQGQHPEDGKLGTDGLAAAGWCADEHVLVSVVQRVKN